MDIGYIFIVIVFVLLSMTLHEAMHAFVSYWLGDDTAKAQGRLTLNPIKHIDPFLTLILPIFLAIVGGPIFGGAKPVPFRPERVRGGEWGAALVAIAGPLTNLLLAFVIFGIGVMTGTITASGIDAFSLSGTLIMTGIGVNLGFFVFNIIPIPPLDGSRVLYALAPEFARRGMEAIERVGIFVIFIIVIIASGPIGQIMSTVVSGILKFFTIVFHV